MFSTSSTSSFKISSKSISVSFPKASILIHSSSFVLISSSYAIGALLTAPIKIVIVLSDVRPALSVSR